MLFFDICDFSRIKQDWDYVPCRLYWSFHRITPLMLPSRGSTFSARALACPRLMSSTDSADDAALPCKMYSMLMPPVTFSFYMRKQALSARSCLIPCDFAIAAHAARCWYFAAAVRSGDDAGAYLSFSTLSTFDHVYAACVPAFLQKIFRHSSFAWLLRFLQRRCLQMFFFPRVVAPFSDWAGRCAPSFIGDILSPSYVI